MKAASTRPISRGSTTPMRASSTSTTSAPLLIVNAANIDPVQNQADYDELVGRHPPHEEGPHVLQPAAPRYYLVRGVMYTHLEQRDSTRPPVSLGTLDKMKREHEKIACITCYDASFAVLCDNADTDLVLVGDSLGMVLQGHDTTVPVTMDDIVYHCKAVARGLHRPFLVADLPFASYPTRRHRAGEFRAPHAGRRRGDGQARERHRPARDRRIPRAPRHRGVRAPGPQAAVGAQDRWLSGAGPRRSRGQAHARQRQGAGVRGRGHRAARMHSVRARQEDHRGARSAGHRHRRGPGHRRPDPRALRRARHHLGPQAALREEFHGRRDVESRRAASATSRP